MKSRHITFSDRLIRLSVYEICLTSFTSLDPRRAGKGVYIWETYLLLKLLELVILLLAVVFDLFLCLVLGVFHTL